MDVLCLTGYGDFTNRVNNAISLLQKNKKLNVHAIVFGKHNYNSLKLQSKSKYKKIKESLVYLIWISNKKL